jgi:hypothetical protein
MALPATPAESNRTCGRYEAAANQNKVLLLDPKLSLAKRRFHFDWRRARGGLLNDFEADLSPQFGPDRLNVRRNDINTKLLAHGISIGMSTGTDVGISPIGETGPNLNSLVTKGEFGEPADI